MCRLISNAIFNMHAYKGQSMKCANDEKSDGLWCSNFQFVFFMESKNVKKEKVFK